MGKPSKVGKEGMHLNLLRADFYFESSHRKTTETVVFALGSDRGSWRVWSVYVWVGGEGRWGSVRRLGGLGVLGARP